MNGNKLSERKGFCLKNVIELQHLRSVSSVYGLILPVSNHFTQLLRSYVRTKEF